MNQHLFDYERLNWMDITYVDIDILNKHYLDSLGKDPSINQFIHVDDSYSDYLIKTPGVIFKFVFIDNDLVGGLHIETSEQIATFSISILSQYQRRGIGSRILNDLKENKFKLDIVAYVVYIERINEISLKIFEKSGFLLDGIEDDLNKYRYII